MIYGCFVFCCEFVCFVFSLFDLGLLVVWGLCCCWVFCLWWFVFDCGDVGWCTLLLVVVVLFVVWFVWRFEGCLIGWGMYWCTRLCIVIGVCFSVLN